MAVSSGEDAATHREMRKRCGDLALGDSPMDAVLKPPQPQGASTSLVRRQVEGCLASYPSLPRQREATKDTVSKLALVLAVTTSRGVRMHKKGRMPNLAAVITDDHVHAGCQGVPTPAGVAAMQAVQSPPEEASHRSRLSGSEMREEGGGDRAAAVGSFDTGEAAG